MTLQRGDVVWCAFPEDETPTQPGLKFRPCIVAGAPRQAPSGVMVVSVVYGTTIRGGTRAAELPSKRLARGRLRVDPGQEGLVPGLSKATIFDTTRVRSLPLVPAFFRIAPDGGWRHGTLPAAKLAELERCWRHGAIERDTYESAIRRSIGALIARGQGQKE